MRITYIHQYFATLDSSSAIRTYNFSKFLVSRGHSVTVITSDAYLPEKYKNKKRFELDGISIINIKTSYTKELDIARRLRSFLKFMIVSTWLSLKSSPDLVFATSPPLTIAFPGLITKFIKNVPFVFEVRDSWPDVPVELGIIKNKLLIFLLKLFEKTAYRFADMVVCISDGIRLRVSVPVWKKIHIPFGLRSRFF